MPDPATYPDDPREARAFRMDRAFKGLGSAILAYRNAWDRYAGAGVDRGQYGKALADATDRLNRARMHAEWVCRDVLEQAEQAGASGPTALAAFARARDPENALDEARDTLTESVR